MSEGVALVTGSAGLIGSTAVRRLCALGYEVVGIDNDARGRFFGPEASTAAEGRRLARELPGYRQHDLDIRARGPLLELVASLGDAVRVVVHAAAQPSHDWAARDPFTDFDVNAVGTLNLLEACRQACPAAVFVFASTNKVYGDRPNRLPLVERATRFELAPGHRWAGGIDETMPIDASTHSLFGVSKTAADLLVQEYARYFGMTTGVFRAGCVTGAAQAGAPLHGFLSYLARCSRTGTPYTIHGHGGKQVRDNLHAADAVAAFEAFIRAPRPGEVYNLGGGPENAVSVLEAVALCEEVGGRRPEVVQGAEPRRGDHRWWVSDTAKLRAHYPEWRPRVPLRDALREMVSGPE